VSACGTPNEEVRPDEMSAEAHRQEAERVRAHAADEQARYDPNSEAPPPGGMPREAGPSFPIVIASPINPTLRHLDRAAGLDAHARAHERAAAQLESDEEAACRGLPAGARAACPVLLTVAVEDLPNGVRLHLRAEPPIDAILAQLRCHLMWARAHGLSPTAFCPIYLPGTRIQRSGDDAIDLVSDDRATARRLQALIHH
jgi:hypothetical protein